MEVAELKRRALYPPCWLPRVQARTFVAIHRPQATASESVSFSRSQTPAPRSVSTDDYGSVAQSLLLLYVIKDPHQEVSEQNCFCCLGRSSNRTSGWLGGFFRRPIAPLNSSMRATCSPRSIEADHKGAVLLERVLDKLHANAGVGCFDELPNANLDLSEGLEHGSIVVTNNCWLSEPIRVPRRR
jgi:hypothetical protein